MRETLVRSLSGLIYVSLLLICIRFEHALIALFFIFGLICMGEFKKLIQLKSHIPYFIFITLYAVFGYWQSVLNTNTGLNEAMQILMVLSIFVVLFLIKDLFSRKNMLHFFIYLFFRKRWAMYQNHQSFSSKNYGFPIFCNWPSDRNHLSKRVAWLMRWMDWKLFGK